MRKQKILLLVYFILLIIYEETIFHLFVFEKFTFNFLYIILFSIPIGSLCYLLSNLFKDKWNRIPTYIFAILVIFLFISNFIYYKVYLSIISLYSFLNGNQVLGFINHIILIAKNNWYVILLMILPLIIIIVLDTTKKISYQRICLLNKLIILVAIIIVQVSTLISIQLIKSNDIYSNKNLYSNIHSPLLTSERFGLITTFRLDCQRLIFGFKEKDLEVEIPNTNIDNGLDSSYDDDKIEITYNELEIDWDYLINNETDETIKSMHNYFSLQLPTNKNDYLWQ